MTDTIKDYSTAQRAMGLFYRATSHSRETGC